MPIKRVGHRFRMRQQFCVALFGACAGKGEDGCNALFDSVNCIAGNVWIWFEQILARFRSSLQAGAGHGRYSRALRAVCAQ